MKKREFYRKREFHETKAKTYAKARNHFRQLWYLDKEIESKLHLSEYLKRRIATAAYQKTKDGNAAKLADVRAKLHENIKELAVRIDETVALINTLGDTKTRALLFMHYVNRMTVEEISETMGCGVTKLHRLHSEALAEFEKVLDGQGQQ